MTLFEHDDFEDVPVRQGTDTGVAWDRAMPWPALNRGGGDGAVGFEPGSKVQHTLASAVGGCRTPCPGATTAFVEVATTVIIVGGGNSDSDSIVIQDDPEIGIANITLGRVPITKR